MDLHQLDLQINGRREVGMLFFQTTKFEDFARFGALRRPWPFGRHTQF
jgi:hypothetical protein